MAHLGVYNVRDCKSQDFWLRFKPLKRARNESSWLKCQRLWDFTLSFLAEGSMTLWTYFFSVCSNLRGTAIRATQPTRVNEASGFCKIERCGLSLNPNEIRRTKNDVFLQLATEKKTSFLVSISFHFRPFLFR